MRYTLLGTTFWLFVICVVKFVFDVTWGSAALYSCFSLIVNAGFIYSEDKREEESWPLSDSIDSSSS